MSLFVDPKEALSTIQIWQRFYGITVVTKTDDDDDDPPYRQPFTVADTMKFLASSQPGDKWVIRNEDEGYEDPVVRIGLARNRRTGELALNLVVDTSLAWYDDWDEDEEEPEITPDPDWQGKGF